MTKIELLEGLRASGDDLVSKVQALPPDAFAQGRYENGWSAREILAHVAAIEWTYKRLIDGAREPATAPKAPPASSTPQRDPSQPASGSPIDDYNARIVAKRADKTVAGLLDEFRENRAGTIASVEGADDDLLAKPVRSAGGAQGTLAQVLDFVAVQHVRQHTRDIMGEHA